MEQQAAPPQVVSEVHLFLDDRGSMRMRIDGAASKDLLMAARMIRTAERMILEPQAPPEPVSPLVVAREMPALPNGRR